MRSKNHPSFLGLTLFPNSLPSILHQHREMGNGSFGQFIMYCFCCCFLLRGRENSFPCTSLRSLPPETVLYKLLQCESFPHVAVFPVLLQHGSPSGGAVLSANLLQCGLLSSWLYRSSQEPAPV